MHWQAARKLEWKVTIKTTSEQVQAALGWPGRAAAASTGAKTLSAQNPLGSGTCRCCPHGYGTCRCCPLKQGRAYSKPSRLRVVPLLPSRLRDVPLE